MNQDYIQTMPNNEYMVKAKMTLQDSINYYKNWWTRMLASFLIDVEFDKIIMATNPDEIVPDHNEEPIPVKIRLERRKMNVETAQKMLKAIEILEKVAPEKFHETFLSEEALKVSDVVVAEQTGETATPATEEKVTDAEVVTPAPAAEASNEAKA